MKKSKQIINPKMKKSKQIIRPKSKKSKQIIGPKSKKSKQIIRFRVSPPPFCSHSLSSYPNW